MPYELHKLDNLIKGERQNVISLVGWLYSGKKELLSLPVDIIGVLRLQLKSH